MLYIYCIIPIHLVGIIHSHSRRRACLLNYAENQTILSKAIIFGFHKCRIRFACLRTIAHTHTHTCATQSSAVSTHRPLSTLSTWLVEYNVCGRWWRTNFRLRMRNNIRWIPQSEEWKHLCVAVVVAVVIVAVVVVRSTTSSPLPSLTDKIF